MYGSDILQEARKGCGRGSGKSGWWQVRKGGGKLKTRTQEARLKYYWAFKKYMIQKRLCLISGSWVNEPVKTHSNRASPPTLHPFTIENVGEDDGVIWARRAVLGKIDMPHERLTAFVLDEASRREPPEEVAARVFDGDCKDVHLGHGEDDAGQICEAFAGLEAWGRGKDGIANAGPGEVAVVYERLGFQTGATLRDVVVRWRWIEAYAGAPPTRARLPFPTSGFLPQLWQHR
ncbi:hypothetical protein C8R47DRAFT_1063622 [Mycena vitilis]|nr:hypothetical protein C8R47DRAFT_1063622 [Mycena vitilis]